MANRYWVGGTGTWNTTSTTNWSATSGGAGGASVPTTADSVFFDQAGTYSVTLTGTLACSSFTVSAGTVTFVTGTSPTITIAGSVNWTAAPAFSGSTFSWSFAPSGATVSINTSNVSIPGNPIAFNNGTFNLASNFTTTANFTLNNGSLINTNNYTVSISSFFGTSGALNLGSSTVNLTGSPAFNNIAIALNAGTSQINARGTTLTAANSNYTFYNVSLTSTATGTRIINGTNTFNNLTLSGPSSIGVATYTFSSKQIINGTLSTTGTAGNRRVFLASATYGLTADLVVNSTPSLVDADFRGLYVTGTAAPISGTRLGNRGECRGITFSTAKSVYWNLAGTQNWSANGWAATSGGTPSTDNFPLPQDTAVFDNNGSVTGTISLDSAIGYTGTINMSARTTAMTLNVSVANIVYGSWINGPGTTLTGFSTVSFSGGNTHTITSAGKSFSPTIDVDSYGGIVQLGDALTTGTIANVRVTNGTFDTKGYSVTTGALSSNNTNIRTILLRSSTITLTSATTHVGFGTTTGITFDAGTSNVNVIFSTTNGGSHNWGNITWNNVTITNTAATNRYSFVQTPNFNNLTLVAPNATGVFEWGISNNFVVTGTLTCSGATPVRRNFIFSSVTGTQRDISVGTLAASDCDFRDIDILGSAAGTAPTRAGDCGGNSGIAFPAPKTVYWNLAGSQSWGANAWASSSGGTPDLTNFPLPQDTAVFDNAVSIGTISLDATWSIGTLDASARTSAMSIIITSTAFTPTVYGNWKSGTGLTITSSTAPFTFAKLGTQTITSNGVQFGCPLIISNPACVIQLADAISLPPTRSITLTSGTFDAVSYNVTTGTFINSAATNTVKMGFGTWTLSGVGTVWDCTTLPILQPGTATIVLSDTSTSARTFSGGGTYYNKLTIGGTTGSSTLTIIGNNQFGELASTKTVSHTIALGTTSQSISKWSVTGTAGNTVVISGSATISIIGSAVTGVDYLSLGTVTLSSTSPAEFFAGANSTGGTNFTSTAAPAPRTLYWVGGTGTWSSAAKWATSSNGTPGAAIPTSLDDVIFDSASGSASYTATIDSTQARCKSMTVSAPASGAITLAGTGSLALHGNLLLPASGIANTYTGILRLAGSTNSSITLNGNTVNSPITVFSNNSTWSLGGPLLSINTLSLGSGTFNTAGFTAQFSNISMSSNFPRSLVLGSSTVTVTGASTTAISFSPSNNFTLSAADSTINLSGSSSGISGGGFTFGTVNFTNVGLNDGSLPLSNTFNVLSFAGRSALLGISAITFGADQTIGTLTLNPGTSPTYRTFLASNSVGTTRTLNVGVFTAGAADYDFRDIIITGTAAPITSTRAGDCGGNSGIVFPAAKTVYFRAPGGGSWGTAGSGGWSLTNGGAFDATAFPLAQDTAVFPSSPTPYPNSAGTVTVNAAYNIGTIDMSARTTNTMTLATSTGNPFIYGNWINGTGTTLTGTGVLFFGGRNGQTITSAGKTFVQQVSIIAPGSTVTLADAMIVNNTSSGITLNAGTFNAATYNVTLINGATVNASSGTAARTLAVGSGTWTIDTSSAATWNTSGTNITVTGTGTISLTGFSAKTFSGGGLSYAGITLNQGGPGTLTISGNNTFKTITNSYSSTNASSISLGSTIQTLVEPWAASGAAGKVLTVSGTSTTFPGTLIFAGTGLAANVDYLTLTNIRAYPLKNKWYAGNSSSNGGSLGWNFSVGSISASTIYYGGLNIASIFYGSTPVSAIYYGSIKVF